MELTLIKRPAKVKSPGATIYFNFALSIHRVATDLHTFYNHTEHLKLSSHCFVKPISDHFLQAIAVYNRLLFTSKMSVFVKLRK